MSGQTINNATKHEHLLLTVENAKSPKPLQRLHVRPLRRLWDIFAKSVSTPHDELALQTQKRPPQQPLNDAFCSNCLKMGFDILLLYLHDGVFLHTILKRCLMQKQIRISTSFFQQFTRSRVARIPCCSFSFSHNNFFFW